MNLTGALYCHLEKADAIEAANSFKSVNSGAQFLLVGNVQENLTYLEGQLGVTGLLIPPYVDLLKSAEKKPRTEWPEGFSLDLVKNSIQMATLVCGRVETEHFFPFHPDHRFIRPLKDHQMSDYSMGYSNPYSQAVIAWVNKHSKSPFVPKGYSITNVVSKSCMNKIIDFFHTETGALLELEKVSGSLTAYDDFLFPILAHLTGCNVEVNFIVREVHRQITWRNFLSPSNTMSLFAPVYHGVR